MKSILILAFALTIVGCGGDQEPFGDEPLGTAEEGLCTTEDLVTSLGDDAGAGEHSVTSAPTGSYCDGHFDVVYKNVQGRDLLAYVRLADSMPAYETDCESTSIKLTGYREIANARTKRKFWSSIGTTECTGRWFAHETDEGITGDAGAAPGGSCSLRCKLAFKSFGYSKLRLQVEAESSWGTHRANVNMTAR